jgi:hypothetical protein
VGDGDGRAFFNDFAGPVALVTTGKAGIDFNDAERLVLSRFEPCSADLAFLGDAGRARSGVVWVGAVGAIVWVILTGENTDRSTVTDWTEGTTENVGEKRGGRTDRLGER